MSGFDNGTTQQAITAQVQQFGAIIRGNGAPLPSTGVPGAVYVDSVSGLLYVRRSGNVTDPWGNWLFLVPLAQRTLLKWFGTTAPPNTVGSNGDYALVLGGPTNYGASPMVSGPKAGGVWPAAINFAATDTNPLAFAENEHPQ